MHTQGAGKAERRGCPDDPDTVRRDRGQTEADRNGSDGEELRTRGPHPGTEGQIQSVSFRSGRAANHRLVNDSTTFDVGVTAGHIEFA
jgi:hypothetical protein